MPFLASFLGGILTFPSPFQTAYLKACFNGRMQISWDSSSVGVVNDSLVSLGTSLNSGQKTHNTIFTAPLHPRPSTLSGAHANTRQSINLLSPQNSRATADARKSLTSKGARRGAPGHEQSAEEQRVTFNFKAVLMRFGEEAQEKKGKASESPERNNSRTGKSSECYTQTISYGRVPV